MIPARYARYYLENAPSLLTLIAINLTAMLVGIRFYVESMEAVPTLIWPFYLDSPMATFLMSISLIVLVPNLGNSLDRLPQNQITAYIHTLAFVWLVKYGIWTVIALNLGFDHYFPSITDYWFIVITHLAFVIQAYLIPHYGRTSRSALIFSLAVLLANDLIDYGLGFHPPLRYELDPSLAIITISLTFFTVLLANRAFDRIDDGE